MGKMRNKKLKSQLFNPTKSGKKDEATDGESMDCAASSSVVKNLLQQIQSSRTEDKECACNTIANIVLQPDTTKEFLKQKTVKILAPLMLDAENRVQTFALGALRNMTIGVDMAFVCNEMVKQDIMTPLVALLNKFHVDCDQLKEIEITDVFNQAVNLLWNVCENSESAVKIFNKESLQSVLLKIVKEHKTSRNSDTVLAIVQCLYSVSENNQMLCLELSKELSLFHEVIKSNHTNMEELLIKVSVAGILHNISSNTSVTKESELAINNVTMGLLSEVLHLDVMTPLQESLALLQNLKLKNALPFDEEGVTSPSETQNESEEEVEMNATCEEKKDNITNDPDKNNSKDSKPMQKEYKQVRSQQRRLEHLLKEANTLVQNQQLAVEILANLCSSNDDEDWEDVENTSSDDEVVMDTSEINESSMATEESKSNDVIEPLLQQYAVIERVFCKCRPVDETFRTSSICFKVMEPVIERVEQLQIYSLLCLSNMIDILSDKYLMQPSTAALTNTEFNSSKTRLENLWLKLGTIMMSSCSSQHVNESGLEALSNSLRSVLEKIKKIQPKLVNTLSAEDLKYLYDLVYKCKEPETRANIIRIVGCIGCALAVNPVLHQHLKSIGQFLIEVIGREQAIWVAAECLDCVFDIFAEDHLNNLIKELSLLDVLQKFIPIFKLKAKEQRNTLEEHSVIVHEAKSNLYRFIQYKKSVIK